MLSISNVSVSRGGKLLLQSVQMGVCPGKITAIIGPNGSGKSTLLKTMAGVMECDSGQITLEQRALATWPRKQLARKLAYLPQSSERPLGMSVEEVVACGRYAHLPPWASLRRKDHEAIERALQDTEMTHKSSAQVDNLSGGEMQRVWLATILAQGSDLLLLDEPSSYLDLSHQLDLLALIQRLNREQGKTIVLVIHDLNQALHWCDEIVVMQAGKIIKAGDINLLQDAQLLRHVFNLSAQYIQLEENARPLLHATRLSKVHEVKR